MLLAEQHGAVDEEHGPAVVEEAQHEQRVHALARAEQHQQPRRANLRVRVDARHDRQRADVQRDEDPLRYSDCRQAASAACEPPQRSVNIQEACGVYERSCITAEVIVVRATIHGPPLNLLHVGDPVYLSICIRG